jgi:hypothetical protein
MCGPTFIPSPNGPHTHPLGKEALLPEVDGSQAGSRPCRVERVPILVGASIRVLVGLVQQLTVQSC